MDKQDRQEARNGGRGEENEDSAIEEQRTNRRISEELRSTVWRESNTEWHSSRRYLDFSNSHADPQRAQAWSLAKHLLGYGRKR